MRRPQLTQAGLTVGDVPDGCLALDVLFAGRRIWTVEVSTLPPDQDTPVLWPEALTAYLVGHTDAAVADSATGEILWHGHLLFTDDDHETVVERSDGTPLSINKWELLAPDLSDMSEATIASLLTETERLIEFLHSHHMRPFIVGGTLLGAVRTGTLLPHDDDVDIAFLSMHTSPAIVGAETLALARQLRNAGYEVIEHSAAHLQLIFRNSYALPAYHIDVFAAFFTDDGHINQPFHVRGPFSVDQMLPFGTATLHGVDFPAPADVESWLELNYDENWRTPIPGFALETPEETTRRFENWFGGFNFRREFWDEWHANPATATAPTWRTGQRWLEEQQLASPLIFDLGSGSGRLSRAIATRRPDSTVVGADFSEQALLRANSPANEPLPNLSYRNVNLSMLSALRLPSEESVVSQFDVVSNHVLEQMSHRARANALRLIRMALRSGGSGYATLNASFASDVSPDDPTTWHLEQEALAAEAAALGISVTFTPLLPAPGEASRNPYGAHFTLSGQPFEPEPPSKKAGTALFSRARGLLGRFSQVRELDLYAEIVELRAEVDELRHDRLQVAEVLNLVEEYLTPRTGD